MCSILTLRYYTGRKALVFLSFRDWNFIRGVVVFDDEYLHQRETLQIGTLEMTDMLNCSVCRTFLSFSQDTSE